MTVYFAHKVGDPTEIKIGTAKDIGKRMSALATYFGPMRLFATMQGGGLAERRIHQKFAELRTEGEWFKANDNLREFIRVVADEDDREFGPTGPKWKTKAKSPVLRRGQDAAIALRLLDEVISRHPGGTPISKSLEMAFQRLHAINDGWTRRRVRALRELQGLRVDLFEIVDLLRVLEIPKRDWAEWIAPELSEDND